MNREPARTTDRSCSERPVPPPDAARAAPAPARRRPAARRALTAVAVAAVAFGAVVAGWAGAPRPAEAAIGAVCPVPPSQVANGVDVCVDRGDDATYSAGSPISVCVSVSIPQIAIFPPPPPPTIRVESVLPDGTTQLLIEARTASGQQCASGTIVEPFGAEVVRARALGPDGTAFQEDVARFTTVPR